MMKISQITGNRCRNLRVLIPCRFEIQPENICERGVIFYLVTSRGGNTRGAIWGRWVAFGVKGKGQYSSIDGVAVVQIRIQSSIIKL